MSQVKIVYDTPAYDIPSREQGQAQASIPGGSVRKILSEHFNGWLRIAEGWVRPVKIEWVSL